MPADRNGVLTHTRSGLFLDVGSASGELVGNAILVFTVSRTTRAADLISDNNRFPRESVKSESADGDAINLLLAGNQCLRSVSAASEHFSSRAADNAREATRIYR